MRVLGVKHGRVTGHARCGGVGALVGESRIEGGAELIGPWVSIADQARQVVQREHGGEGVERQARACELAALRVSLKNLTTFPFVHEAVAAGRLGIHGWYFDIETGELLCYTPASDRFDAVVGGLGISGGT